MPCERKGGCRGRAEGAWGDHGSVRSSADRAYRAVCVFCTFFQKHKMPLVSLARLCTGAGAIPNETHPPDGH